MVGAFRKATIPVVAAGALAASAAAGVASGTPGPSSRGGAAAGATIQVGGSPSSIVATAGSVWVSLGLAGVARVDPESNEVAARIRPGGAVIDLAAGFGAVWAVDVFGDRLLEIDPRTNRVTRAVRVDEMPSGVDIGLGLVWVTSQLGSTVSGVDPRTGRVVEVVRFGYGELWPGALAVTADGVWVITDAGNELTLVDPRRRVVARRIRLRGARTLAVVGGSLWIGVAHEQALLRVDDRGVARQPAVGHRADGYGPVLAGGRRLLLATGGHVEVVDPDDGSIRPVLRLKARHRVSAAAFAGDVWVADETAAALVRTPMPHPIGRLVASGRPLRRPPGDHPNG